MSDATGLIERYLQGPEALRQALAGMSEDELRARPIAGKWSALEVVCHLADSEQAWCHRMKRVIAEDRPLLVGYDESRFSASLFYQSADPAEALELVDRSRRDMGRILLRLSPEAWARQGVHTERGLISLETMVEVEVDHLNGHVERILEKRRAMGV